jgi:hypothetical protein
MDTQRQRMKNKMAVDSKTRNRVNYFIYAYETFDESEISSNLLDIPIKDIREVLSVDFYIKDKYKT